ncbi:hypothetical protein [Corallococcus exercitus]|uniref:hypothetical protein n=1 Tax=Corallococcus exercitus TaxID=2316736 RepID=UPI0035D41C75
MRMLMKSLLTVSAVVSLVPAAAFAYPPQCFEICESEWCDAECAIGPRTWTTCREYAPSWCLGVTAGPSEPTASVTEAEARQADDASRVCSEENPDASAER